MSTTLVVRFPWGRYHGTPWGRHVNEAAIEWPPSPWRLLRAMYATWKCRFPELDEAVVHSMLDALSVAPTYIVPKYIEAHTRHYMPDLNHKPLVANGTDKVIDAFAVFERDGELAITWPVELATEQREALEQLAEQLSYLGRAESICEARVASADDSLPDGIQLTPRTADNSNDAMTMRVLTPTQPLDIDALIARTTKIRRKDRLLVPTGTYWQEYSRPQPTDPLPVAPRRTNTRPRPTAIRWAIATPAKPSVKGTLAMTDVLRQACMSRFGHQNDNRVSLTLAGKGADGEPLAGHRHAHYLAIDTDGDRLLDTAIVWAPDGFERAELDAFATLSQLRGHGHIADFRECRLGLEAVGSINDVAPELVGPSRAWMSSTPFAPARHGRRNTPWDEHLASQIRTELGYRNLQDAEGIEVLRGDWLDYRRYRPSKQRLQDARRASGLKLTFTEPISGPIVLGALSHFGLGVFQPTQ